ncbi:unnamed protein product [Closterium sp. NIES-64]|nr:unnamed protein product [Closterium sp. NIES-64]
MKVWALPPTHLHLRSPSPLQPPFTSPPLLSFSPSTPLHPHNDSECRLIHREPTQPPFFSSPLPLPTFLAPSPPLPPLSAQPPPPLPSPPPALRSERPSAAQSAHPPLCYSLWAGREQLPATDVAWFPDYRAYALSHQTAEDLVRALAVGVVGAEAADADEAAEVIRGVKLPSRRPALVSETCLFLSEPVSEAGSEPGSEPPAEASSEEDVTWGNRRVRTFHVLDSKGMIDTLGVFVEEREGAGEDGSGATTAHARELLEEWEGAGVKLGHPRTQGQRQPMREGFGRAMIDTLGVFLEEWEKAGEAGSGRGMKKMVQGQQQQPMSESFWSCSLPSPLPLPSGPLPAFLAQPDPLAALIPPPSRLALLLGEWDGTSTPTGQALTIPTLLPFPHFRPYPSTLPPHQTQPDDPSALIPPSRLALLLGEWDGTCTTHQSITTLFLPTPYWNPTNAPIPHSRLSLLLGEWDGTSTTHRSAIYGETVTHSTSNFFLTRFSDSSLGLVSHPLPSILHLHSTITHRSAIYGETVTHSTSNFFLTRFSDSSLGLVSHPLPSILHLHSTITHRSAIYGETVTHSTSNFFLTLFSDSSLGL